MIKKIAHSTVKSLFREYTALTIKSSDMPKNLDFKKLVMKFDDSKGGCYYIGQWNSEAEQGKEREGFGIEITEDQDLYEGFWYQGKYDGFGRLISRRGKIYQGQFKFGLPHGLGVTMTTHLHDLARENREYGHKGNYEKGAYHGFGILDYKNEFKYVGFFLKGKMDDPEKGKIEYPNGTIYKGGIKKGKKEGKGTINYEDGSSYIGDFSNDKMEGKGEQIIMNPDGTYKEKYVGEFSQDLRNGDGDLYTSGSKVAKVVYNKGELVFDE